MTPYNGGTTTIDNTSVVYELTIGTVTSPACNRLPDLPASGECLVAPLAPGGTIVVTFLLTGDPSVSASPGAVPLQELGENLVQIRVGDQKLATQPPLGKVILR